MKSEIGSYEAKTKLPALLRDVQRGQRYTITLRGDPVADLVPVGVGTEVARREAIAAMRAIPKVRGVSDAEIQGWVAEGRR